MPRFLVPIFVLLAALAAVAFFSLRDAPLTTTEPPTRLRIERGMGLSAIGDAVAAELKAALAEFKASYR